MSVQRWWDSETPELSLLLLWQLKKKNSLGKKQNTVIYDLLLFQGKYKPYDSCTNQARHWQLVTLELGNVYNCI
jgi:hypothetical protein